MNIPIQIEYAYFAGHVVTVGFIKLTILFFFRRIFKGKKHASCPPPQILSRDNSVSLTPERDVQVELAEPHSTMPTGP